MGEFQDVIASLEILAFYAAIYFLPFLLGLVRKHKSVGGIFVVNLFFGWTIVGWILALAWAASNPGVREQETKAS